MVFLQILVATLLITVCVLIAVLFLFFKKETLSKITLFLVSLSAGTLIGGAFLHLLPEATESMEPESVFLVAMAAVVVFFFVERLLHWRHCHNGECKIHTFGYMSLIGDSVHNLIDGIIIAASFVVDFRLGVITTVAIALHEIPQEIGDFGVLIHAGFGRLKAFLLNYGVALTVVLGGIVGYFSLSYIENITSYLLPFAAGGFIYVAGSDLLPEIRKETNLKKSLLSFLSFLGGIALMYAIKIIGE